MKKYIYTANKYIALFFFLLNFVTLFFLARLYFENDTLMMLNECNVTFRAENIAEDNFNDGKIRYLELSSNSGFTGKKRDGVEIWGWRYWNAKIAFPGVLLENARRVSQLNSEIFIKVYNKKMEELIRNGKSKGKRAKGNRHLFEKNK